MPDDRITWSKKEWLRVHPLSNLIFWHSDQFNKTQSHARIRDFNQLAGRIFEILLAVLSRIIRVGYARSPSFCMLTADCMLSYANANVTVQNRTWHRDAGPLHCWWPKVGEDFWMLVTELRCWWHLLVPDQYGPCKMTLYRWPCFWIRTYDTNNVGPTIQWWTWNKRKLWYHVTLQLASIMTSKIWYYCGYSKMNSDRAFMISPIKQK